jgi:hypothetical protein
MTVTPQALLAGLMPVVISGGRPALRQRHLHRLLSAPHVHAAARWRRLRSWCSVASEKAMLNARGVGMAMLPG